MLKLLGTLVLALTIVDVSSTQGHGDFSGTWKLDEARSGSPGWAEFVRPVTRVIRLAPSMLEIDVTEGVKTTNFRYPLTAAKPAGGKDVLASNRAYWEGDRLITETMHALSGQTVTMREEQQHGARRLRAGAAVTVGFSFEGPAVIATVERRGVTQLVPRKHRV